MQDLIRTIKGQNILFRQNSYKVPIERLDSINGSKVIFQTNPETGELILPDLDYNNTVFRGTDEADYSTIIIHTEDSKEYRLLSDPMDVTFFYMYKGVNPEIDKLIPDEITIKPEINTMKKSNSKSGNTVSLINVFDLIEPKETDK